VIVWPKNAEESFARRRRLQSTISKSECNNEVTGPALRPMYPGCNREMPCRRPAIRSPMCSDRSSIFTIRVPLALYCAQSIALEPLPTVLAQTISIGGDTDTIASIVGQLAGTLVGSAGVPDNLVGEVNGGEELKAIAEDFAEFVAKRSPQSIQVDI
jgi:hypothetical protein